MNRPKIDERPAATIAAIFRGEDAVPAIFRIRSPVPAAAESRTSRASPTAAPCDGAAAVHAAKCGPGPSTF